MWAFVLIIIIIVVIIIIFTREKTLPPMFGDTNYFQLILFMNFYIDHPANPRFSSNFCILHPPWNSSYFYSTSLEFSIVVILNMSCIGSPARFRTFNTFEIIFLCNFVFFNVLILLFYYNKNISFLNVPFLFFNYLN